MRHLSISEFGQRLPRQPYGLRMGLASSGGDDGGGGGDDGGGGGDAGNVTKGPGGYSTQAGVWETLRRSSCAAQGLVWDQQNDVCVEPDQGGQSSGGGNYGPAPGSCEEQGFVTLPNGQCGPKDGGKAGAQTGNSQFVEYKGTPEGEEPPEPVYPPWMQKKIEDCEGEGKIYDAASDSCVDDPDASKDQPRDKGKGGGGGGGGGLAKVEKAEPSQAMIFAKLAIMPVGFGVAGYGFARLQGNKYPLAYGAAGFITGILLDVVIAKMTDGAGKAAGSLMGSAVSSAGGK